MKIASFIKIALFINEHKRKEIWDLRFEGLLCPLRGKGGTQYQKGCISNGRRPVVWFFLRPLGRLRFFTAFRTTGPAGSYAVHPEDVPSFSIQKALCQGGRELFLF